MPQMGAARWFVTLDDGFTVVWRDGHSSRTIGIVSHDMYVKTSQGFAMQRCVGKRNCGIPAS
jgi:hypothetical protein